MKAAFTVANLDIPDEQVLYLFSMNAISPVPSAEADSAATAPDPKAERAARHVRMLAELADMAMDLARMSHAQARLQVERQAALPEDERPPIRFDYGLVHARLSREIRQTLSAESRIAGAEEDRVAGITAEKTRIAKEIELGERCHAVGRTVNAMLAQDILDEIIEAEEADEDETHRLQEAAYEKLIAAKDEDGFCDRSMGELVASIARDLGLKPDWSRWTCEDWADEDKEDQAWGSPFGRGYVQDPRAESEPRETGPP